MKDKLELIIVSDNHGQIASLEKVLSAQPKADYYFHCGDSNIKPDHPVMNRFITVKGNTDFGCDYPETQTKKLANNQLVWVTHGHRQYVRFAATELVESLNSLSEKPDFVFYGHTHRSNTEFIDGILYINPGSVFEPRDELPPSYVKLTITEDEYLIELNEASSHQPIKEVKIPRP